MERTCIVLFNDPNVDLALLKKAMRFFDHIVVAHNHQSHLTQALELNGWSSLPQRLVTFTTEMSPLTMVALTAQVAEELNAQSLAVSLTNADIVNSLREPLKLCYNHPILVYAPFVGKAYRDIMDMDRQQTSEFKKPA